MFKMKLRTRAFVLTLLFIFVFVLLQTIDLSRVTSFNQEVLKALAVSLVFLGGLYWVLHFKVKGIRLITILGYSSYLVFIQSLFLELIVFQNVGRISEKTVSIIILIIFGLLIHFLILTVNILNVSYISNIPLAQAAKAANFLYTLSGAYFSFLLILRSGAGAFWKLIAFTAVVFLLTLNLFWFKKESFRQLIGETVAVVFALVTLFVGFLLWPLPVEVSTMFYMIVFYILLGLGLEERETTSTLMRVEYAALLGIAVFLLLKLAVWGINGPIL
jgi:hypothetical protein